MAWTLSITSESGKFPCLRYVEDWASEAELRERVRSDHFPRLLALMEAALTRPDIVFNLAGDAYGLEYVEQVRGDRIRGRDV